MPLQNNHLGDASKRVNERVMEYRPDGRWTPLGLFNLIATLALVGATLGFVAHWVSQWFYLVFIFPIVIGFAVGFAGGRTIKSNKLRNPALGGLAGFVAGVFAMVTMHYMDYHSTKSYVSQASEEVQAFLVQAGSSEQVDWSEEEATAYLAGLAGSVTATENFLSYLNAVANEGVTIGRASSSGDGINLGFIGSWIYWIVEILVVAFVVFAVLKDSTAAPFCVECDEWKPGDFLGSLSGEHNELHHAIRTGDVAQCSQASPSTNVGCFNLYRVQCSHAEHGCEIRAEVCSDSKQESATVLGTYSYPRELAETLAALFGTKGEVPAPHVEAVVAA